MARRVEERVVKAMSVAQSLLSGSQTTSPEALCLRRDPMMPGTKTTGTTAGSGQGVDTVPICVNVQPEPAQAVRCLGIAPKARPVCAAAQWWLWRVGRAE